MFDVGYPLETKTTKKLPLKMHHGINNQSRSTYAINVVHLKDIYFNPQQFKRDWLGWFQFNQNWVSVPTDGR